jgi:hypothetical protein
MEKTAKTNTVTMNSQEATEALAAGEKCIYCGGESHGVAVFLDTDDQEFFSLMCADCWSSHYWEADGYEYSLKEDLLK